MTGTGEIDSGAAQESASGSTLSFAPHFAEAFATMGQPIFLRRTLVDASPLRAVKYFEATSQTALKEHRLVLVT
ncbi:MAG: hypothetical protein JWN98_423 [Abditibacteriota bacterium]|nr:hypothetical protein [Abditibacteriota bacterium]